MAIWTPNSLSNLSSFVACIATISIRSAFTTVSGHMFLENKSDLTSAVLNGIQSPLQSVLNCPFQPHHLGPLPLTISGHMARHFYEYPPSTLNVVSSHVILKNAPSSVKVRFKALSWRLSELETPTLTALYFNVHTVYYTYFLKIDLFN